MKITSLIGCVFALACAPTAVFAQQASSTAADAPAAVNRQPLAGVPQPQQPAPLASIATPFKTLYEHGLLVSSYFYDDFQGNPSGGLQQGATNAGAGTLGFDADLQKLAGIPGGRFHLLFTWEFGQTLQSDIGNFIKSQDWYLPGRKFQLAQLAYEQALFGNRLNLLGGRVSAATLFARPTFGCNFISGSQCPYDLPVFTGDFSGYPYATWGGRVRVNFSPATYFQTGGFSVNPTRRFAGGFQLGLNTNTGTVVPFEAGYETDFSNDPYPRHYRLGGWYNNAPASDPLLNTHGVSRVLQGGSPLTNDFGRGGMYGLFDQTIYRPDSSRRNLAVFGSFALPFDQRELLSAQNTVGLYDTGPFARRPFDTAGFMLTQLLFTHAETEFMNQTLTRNGGNGSIKRAQYDFEANYGIQITPGFVVTPNVEYILHPDITQRLDATKVPGNALVLGVRLTLSLADALGLPASLPKVPWGR
jgi:porin